jgi:hypothetical protein
MATFDARAMTFDPVGEIDPMNLKDFFFSHYKGGSPLLHGSVITPIDSSFFFDPISFIDFSL